MREFHIQSILIQQSAKGKDFKHHSPQHQSMARYCTEIQQNPWPLYHFCKRRVFDFEFLYISFLDNLKENRGKNRWLLFRTITVSWNWRAMEDGPQSHPNQFYKITDCSVKMESGITFCQHACVSIILHVYSDNVLSLNTLLISHYFWPYHFWSQSVSYQLGTSFHFTSWCRNNYHKNHPLPRPKSIIMLGVLVKRKVFKNYFIEYIIIPCLNI